MHFLRLLVASCLLASAAACTSEVPAEPTWVDDIRPIFAANCMRCHSPPFIGGSPETIRLDQYGDTLDPDGDLAIAGAASLFAEIETQIRTNSMPPRFPLSDSQAETVLNWVGMGRLVITPPELILPPRGARDGNRPPAFELVGDAQPSGDQLHFDYDLSDPDGDIVTGELLATRGAEVLQLDVGLFSGRGTTVWTTTEADRGTWQLSVLLDDGTVITNTDLIEVVIP